jgi:hypothetical protein
MSKYGAKKTIINGLRFDSKLEATRWLMLCDMQKKKEIQFLNRQRTFVLEAHGKEICKYVADFVYTTPDGLVVEDAKGILTRDFALKAKLFKAQYGFDITLYPPRKRKAIKRKIK